MAISFGSFENSYSYNYNSAYSKDTPNPESQVHPAQKTAINPKNNSDPEVRALKKAGKIECETCKNRTYQDGSNDPGVSFKTPGHIDPKSSASVVMAHEQEHVKNETAKAAAENRRVVSQSVTLQTSVCPECGTSYVSGGQTRTVTKSDPSDNKKDFFLDQFKKVMEGSFGKNIDVKL